MKLDELKKLAYEATHTPEGQWHWNDKYGELCYKSEADDQTYMMSCPLPLNESNSKFIAAANPQTILAMIALIDMQHEALANERYVSRYSHVVEALAAYDKFNGGE